MNISAISASNQPYAGLKFGAARKEEFENPINRNTEKGLAVLECTGVSALAGATAAGLTSCFVEGGIKANKKLVGGVGAGVALATMAFKLPAALYNTSVKAFTREKEMDVFSRDRELKSNIMEEVNNEVKDSSIDLDKKIDHYTSVQMANKGRGLLFKEA